MKRIASLGALALLALTGAASAQGTPEARQIGDFVVRCLPVENPAPCELLQEWGDKQSGQRIGALSIAFMPSANRYIMMVGVPLGVLTEKGVVIETNAFTTQPMLISRCNRGGCYVEAFAPDSLIDGFKKASGQGKVKVVLDNDKPFEWPISFSGFAQAHDYMVEQNRAKAKAPPAGTAAPAAPR
jgi:invasion protein IalB